MVEMAQGERAPLSVGRRFALFEYGFRPFFLLAGVHALVAIPLWLWMWMQGAAALPALPPMFWHGHEMLYGFIVAAIAGFLLTAVPSWTGARGFAGLPLVALVTVWVGGRVVFFAADALPLWVVGLVELSFLPLLAGLLAPPLLRSSNRNTPLLAVIGVLWLLDAAFIASLSASDALLSQRVLRLAIDFVLILVTVIGGRIVPAFTGNALRRQGEAVEIIVRPWLEPIVIGVMVAVAIVDAIWPTSMASGVLAATAAVAQAVRLSGWRGMRMRGEPILWILHVAYVWLPIGLALKALWLLAGVSWATHWPHAFTMGVFGTMILAVMTRASLGHTGRPLAVSRAVAGAYLLLSTGVCVRVFGPALAILEYRWIVCAAGTLWALAFLIYTIVYLPILVGPRVDGKPG